MSKIGLKKEHGVWIALAIVVLGAATYFLFRNNKKKYAGLIINLGGSNTPLAELITRDEGYLQAWAQGLSSRSATFIYNGKIYNTQGGSATTNTTTTTNTNTPDIPIDPYSGLNVNLGNVSDSTRVVIQNPNQVSSNWLGY